MRPPIPRSPTPRRTPSPPHGAQCRPGQGRGGGGPSGLKALKWFMPEYSTSMSQVLQLKYYSCF